MRREPIDSLIPAMRAIIRNQIPSREEEGRGEAPAGTQAVPQTEAEGGAVQAQAAEGSRQAEVAVPKKRKMAVITVQPQRLAAKKAAHPTPASDDEEDEDVHHPHKRQRRSHTSRPQSGVMSRRPKYADYLIGMPQVHGNGYYKESCDRCAKLGLRCECVGIGDACVYCSRIVKARCSKTRDAKLGLGGGKVVVVRIGERAGGARDPPEASPRAAGARRYGAAGILAAASQEGAPAEVAPGDEGMDVDPAPAGGPSAASARQRPTSPAPARRRMGASGWRGDNAMEVDLVSTSNDGWIQRMRRMGEGEKRVLRRVQNNIADLREMMEEEQHRRTTAMEIIHQALLTQGEELRNLHTLTHGCLDDVQELSSEMRRQGNTLHQMGLDIEQVVGLGIRLTELEDQFQMMGYEDPMEERQGAGERLVQLYSGVNTGRYYTDLGTNDQVERQVQAQERAEVESPGGEDDLTRETRLADEADMELQVVAMTAARDSSGTAGTPPTPAPRQLAYWRLSI
ncbi:hypothetical protein C0991_006132 [Blastosporella zonata]|nr:hypothetical protein C0991_006132 [Blastosporella zonata]